MLGWIVFGVPNSHVSYRDLRSWASAQMRVAMLSVLRVASSQLPRPMCCDDAADARPRAT